VIGRDLMLVEMAWFWASAQRCAGEQVAQS
jgi:hypothetical protein